MHFRVCPEWRTLPLDEQRVHIVHELLHVHFEAATDVLREDLKDHLGSAYQPVKASFSRLMEYSIDALADAIAPLLPLPEWPEEEASPPADERTNGHEPVLVSEGV